MPACATSPYADRWWAADEIFTGRWRKHAARPDSFAEQQIKFAQLAQVYNIDMGERLMESMQGAAPPCARGAEPSRR